MTINHARFGNLRNYSFGNPLKEATVYILKLTGGSSAVEPVKQQYLIVNCGVEGATVSIDDSPQEPFTNGKYQKLAVQTFLSTMKSADKPR
jgi:hypothetical protein